MGKSMKYLLWTFSLLSLSFAQAEDCKNITLGGPRNHPPYSEFKDGKMEGIAFEQADFWFEKIGAKVKREKASEVDQENLDKIKAKQLDGLVIGPTNGDLEDDFIFSEPWHKEGINVFYHKDNPLKFFRLTYLREKIGVYDYGRDFGPDFERMKQFFLELKQVGDRDHWIVGLKAKNFDYLLLPFHEGISFIKERNLGKELLYSDKSIFHLPFHFMVSKTHPCATKIESLKQEMILSLKQKKVQKLLEERLSPKKAQTKTASGEGSKAAH